MKKMYDKFVKKIPALFKKMIVEKFLNEPSTMYSIGIITVQREKNQGEMITLN